MSQNFYSDIIVTVYITNFNYGKFIRKAIESVLNQTYQQFEIIIIDDGSTDNSAEIIEEYSQHPKIQVIFQQNKGLNVSNNIALRIAKGKYIMRLDADDFLDTNALLVMTNLLEKDDSLGLVFPDYYIIDASGNILGIEKRHDFDKEVSLFDQPAHGAGTMIRRDFLLKIGGYDEQFTCQDGYDLWVRFVANYKVTNIDTPLFYYRQHGENLTSNEKRILETRAKIKDKFVKNNYANLPDSVCIIPVRGNKDLSKSTALMNLGKDTIIGYKIREAVKSEKTSLVVVSSPDEEIGNYVNKHFGNNQKVHFHLRSPFLARLNTTLAATVENILELETVKQVNPHFLIVLSIEYPFVSSKNIDDALNTMLIFNTDSVISVRPENNVFFRHDGKGMKSIFNQEKFSKLERDLLYRYTGGIIATTVPHFLETKELISGVVGHIVVEQETSHQIRSQFDMEIARFIAATFTP